MVFGTTRAFPALVVLALPMAVAGPPALHAPPPAAAVADTLVLTLDAASSEARYRVREQLAGFDFPNDAVGATSAVSGRIVLDAAGAVDPALSRIEVDVATLKTDQDRRDNYVRRRTLEAEAHPTVVFVPTALEGVPTPLPEEGSARFRLLGELTVRGVTRSTAWEGEATFAPAGVTGSAATRFTFEEFQIAKPRVARVLSVADTIRLELDFTLQREAGGS